MAEQWYKATRKGGVSFTDSYFVYHPGMIIHPNPDKSSVLCSTGIHLAKSIMDLFSIQPDWEEIYLAEPGVILAEDSSKARVASCKIVRLLTDEDLEKAKTEYKEELEKAKAEKKLREEEKLFHDTWGVWPPTLCGIEWLKAHYQDITQDDYDAQGIEIICDRQTLNLKAGLKPKDIRTAIGAVVGK